MGRSPNPVAKGMVFVVLYNDKPMAVCSTEKNAKKFVPKINRDAYRIEEFTIDYGLFNERKGLKFYLVDFNQFGHVRESFVLPASHWTAEFWIGLGAEVEIRVWAESKNEAIDRAKEKRKWLMTRQPGDAEYWDDRR